MRVASKVFRMISSSINRRSVIAGMRCILTASVLGCLATHVQCQQPLPADHAEKMARGRELFAKEVRRLLADRCLKCHGGEKTRAGFNLTTREGLLKGGENGVAVIAGKAKESRLLKLLRHEDEPHMPSNSAKLSDAEINQIAAWIDLGAAFDKPLIENIAGTKKPMKITDDDRRFWSFQPLKRALPPKVMDEAWCKTKLDRFILAKLEAKGIGPSPTVDKRTLLRRAYFDLIGLPPTPEETAQFLNDNSANAYERLIDRLLDSPHYGERWARHWLDLARFAESHGYEQDYDRPTAYHYRDYVIKALNLDLPYDKFVKWQIAGDEMEPENPPALMATGFLAAGTHSTQITANQVEKERYDELDDMSRTIGTSMLGLTVGCARCHDHKYDPISMVDYYRLLSTFTTTVRSDMDVNIDPVNYKKVKTKWNAEHQSLVSALRDYEQQPFKFHDSDLAPRLRYDSRWQSLQKAVAKHQKQMPQPKTVKAMISSEGVPAIRNHTQGGDFLEHTHFLKRGDPNQKGEIASQSFMQVLMRNPDQEKRWLKTPPKGWHTSYRRWALADWICDTEAGAGHLLARVIVNRLWQHHLGRGIVGTPSDFGYQGERPTHPELLDFLATELIKNGWQLKPIHKLIMMSAAYMQSSDPDSRKIAVDPENKLVWRRPRMRLEAETIRDAMLAVGGSLDPKLFGPGTLDPNHKRRSIYFFVKRSQLVPMMTLFDAPDSLQGQEQRATTIIAPQALMLMNNAGIRGYAKSFAARIGSKDGSSLEDAVRAGYLIALARLPNEDELRESAQFVREQTASYQAASKGDARQPALADFCQVLMELNEFIYID
jgi:mono/diheme cytochrome c family protein